MTGQRSAVDAIFFDFDGVILDTVLLKEQAFRQIIVDNAPDHVEPIMEYYWANGGVSRLEKFRWIWANILGQPIDEDRVQALGRDFAERVREQVLTCAFVNGADTFLARHYTQWPCFVISGTPQPELQSLVRGRSLDGYFAGVYGSPPGKAAIGEEILKQRGFDRQRVWFIGDATTDRDAARALGVRFVGLAGPHLSPFLNGDETTINDLTELYGVLNNGD